MSNSQNNFKILFNDYDVVKKKTEEPSSTLRLPAALN